MPLQLDTDGDNIQDDQDNCPYVPNPGQEDSDGDEVGDACDGCPADPGKTEPGICGCGTPDTDTDGDLTPDCNDLCPNDPDKIDPGICGCGTPDTDSDGDLTPDCNDNCPNEPALIDPDELPEQTCDDGIDNDCDGLTDLDDTDDCGGAACRCGDLDDNGSPTNLGDFTKFSVCFGLRGPTAQCPLATFECADLDGNVWVNLTDFTTFSVLFGQVSTNYVPNCP